MSEHKPEQQYAKPLPQQDPVSAPYWSSLREHGVKVQRCEECSRYMVPPASHCPGCLSTRLAWTPLSGKGKVHATVTVEHAPMASFKGDTPYNVALVDLEEGVRVWTNVIGCAPAEVVCDMPVEACYEDATAEFTLLKFKPAARK